MDECEDQTLLGGCKQVSDGSMEKTDIITDSRRCTKFFPQTNGRHRTSNMDNLGMTFCHLRRSVETTMVLFKMQDMNHCNHECILVQGVKSVGPDDVCSVFRSST